MPVVTAQEAPLFEAGATTIRGLTSPSRGARDVSTWRISCAAGEASPVHSLTREETFLVPSSVRTIPRIGSTHSSNESVSAPRRHSLAGRKPGIRLEGVPQWRLLSRRHGLSCSDGTPAG
jgi:hypothetical protein